ncbi:MAG: (2Fe-2S)-binding protein [Proteobacteria bacterium]|nr:(2Fe-2S)-binding protein [Pseudomonadota bacterium]
MKRLTPSPTWRIDPEIPLTFKYEGKNMTGLTGDTVASALYANGVRIFSRSVKYHRPRGLYSLDGESSNSLMEVDGLPNVRTETTWLRPGMVVRPQNVIGSADWDWWGLMDKLDWAMPAGFYYRVFHKPYDLWPFFLRRIRQAAGIGKLNPNWEAGPFEERHLNTDVCVLGGGPAGMSAALAAAEYGLRVVLLEARPWLGGFYDWRVREHPEGGSLCDRARTMAESVESCPDIRVFKHTFVNGLWGDNSLATAFQVGRETDGFTELYLQVRARAMIVATGCLERPLIFENNERPGVMQAGCAHRLARTYGLLPGKTAVFSVGHDIGLEAAADLADLGLKVLAVADCRMNGHDPELVEALSQRGIPFMAGWAASRAEGDKTLEGVVMASLDGLRRQRFACPILVASAGLSPVSGLLALGQARMRYDPHTLFFLPESLPPGLHAAGRLLGYRDARSIEVSGRLAGLDAAAVCGADAEALRGPVREQLAGLPKPAKGSRVVTGPGLDTGRKSFVCFDEDATVKHVAQAFQNGFDMPELAKRFTAAGTGPGQGGIPGHNLPLLMAQMRGEEVEEIRPTTIRPPLVPTLLATYAASHRDVFKRTPLHEILDRSGAIFRRVGPWKRARYFSTDLSAREEIAGVHHDAGLIDVSTLGKFRIFGPDAVQALNRLYIGDMTRIPEGRLKYIAMCNDDGCLIDDGVILKTGENDFYFTTSTGRAGQTIEWFRYHTRYDRWDYRLVNMTDARGAVNLAGPKARSVLAGLIEDDPGPESFPFMACRDTRLGGIPVRILRLGFVGELSYEIHAPASYTRSLWDMLLKAGREQGIRPFGLEAQNVLRLEKGHVIIGQDTEIRTNLIDLGLGFLWDRNKPEARTVGASALRFAESRPGRLKLAGFVPDDPRETPGDGAVIVDDRIRGHVTSSRYSDMLGQSIGLALIEEELSRPGTPIRIFEAGRGGQLMEARVVDRPFYDPDGTRMKG